MTSLPDVTLRGILPPSISGDEQLTALADALDPESHAITEGIRRFLPYLSNLDNLPERIVDLLAWQFHVDAYEPDADIAVKRSLVRDAVEAHRIQGTPAAVKQVLVKVFGAGNARLTEWWQYGGDPYTFRVDTPMTLDQTTMTRLRQAIDAAKNARSHYELYQMPAEASPAEIGIGIVNQQIIQWTLEVE